MDNTTNKTQVMADAAEAEKTEIAATELGKFKDVRALMDAYNSLEAEFTRRSQRLKELENAVKEPVPPEKEENGATPPQGRGKNDGTNLLEAAMSDDAVRNAIISDYLENASKNRGVTFISGGVNVPAVRRTPSTVREAGRLAQEFLNKKEK